MLGNILEMVSGLINKKNRPKAALSSNLGWKDQGDGIQHVRRFLLLPLDNAANQHLVKTSWCSILQ